MNIKLILLSLLISACTHHSKTKLGMHDTIGGEQSSGYDWVLNQTSISPQVWSSDLGFSTHPNDSFRLRNAMIQKALELGKKGILITLSYHQCSVLIDEPCTFDNGVIGTLSKTQWEELLNPQSALHQKWKEQMHKIALHLQVLDEQKIPVYFRPYHEGNLPGFWWAGEASYYKRLWIMLYQYYTKEMKLTHLKWVWSVSFHPHHWKDIRKFYPGDAFVDVIAADAYPPQKDLSPPYSRIYKDLQEVSTTKSLALSEVSRLPTSEELHESSWFYIVPWGINLLKRDNTLEKIQNLYRKN